MVGTPVVVGGAVRDALYGASSKDIDIEVFGTSLPSLTRTLRSRGFEVNEVGKAFGVLKVSKHGKSGVSDLDVAVPRRENVTGTGHRDFDVSLDSEMTVPEAVTRRDFTMNAIVYDPAREVIVDPTGGIDDIAQGVLRHVGEQFAEDPLRVLRAFQFAGRFGMTLHPSTAALCGSLRSQYSDLPKERVREEWGKFFTKSTRYDLGIKALQDSGWDDIIPGLQDALRLPEVARSISGLSQVDMNTRNLFGAAVIAAGMPSNHRKKFLNTVTPNKDLATVAGDLVDVNPEELTTPYTRRVLARKLASRGFTFGAYAEYVNITGDIDAQNVSHAAIREGLGNGPEEDLVLGRDVMELSDRKPGPWVGELLTAARDHQYRGEFEDKSSALEWVREYINSDTTEPH